MSETLDLILGGHAEVRDPGFAKLCLSNSHMERLWRGGRWVEGPVYFGDGRFVLFSDIPNDRMMKYDETSGETSVFRSPARNSNGNTRDRQGRLVTCEHGGRRVTRTEYDGRITVLADAYKGKRLNSPNDVVVSSDGAVWFTDPTYGIDGEYEGDAAPSEIGGSHVYRIDPASGEVAIVADDFVKPNGIAFSPDESLLYIVDTGATHVEDGPRHIRRFRVKGSEAEGRRGLLGLRPRPLRRVPPRHVRQALGKCGRRGALHHARGGPHRQDPGARDGQQRRLRRAQAQPALHDRHDLALRGLSRGAGRVLLRAGLRSAGQHVTHLSTHCVGVPFGQCFQIHDQRNTVLRASGRRRGRRPVQSAAGVRRKSKSVPSSACSTCRS